MSVGVGGGVLSESVGDLPMFMCMMVPWLDVQVYMYVSVCVVDGLCTCSIVNLANCF